MWIERLMAGISHQHVLSYNPEIPAGQVQDLPGGNFEIK